MKSLKDFILESNEWQNHPGAEFIVVNAEKGELLYLTKKELLKEFDISKAEIDAMRGLYSTENEEMITCCHDDSYIIIKKR